MGLPKKLKNFALFGNGESWLGEIPSVTLPKITRKVEDYRAGGMHSSVALDMGHEKLELGIKAGGLKQALIAMLGATSAGASQWRFAGAYQDDSTGTTSAVEVTAHGRLREWNPNEAQAGENSDHDFTADLTYYKLTIDNADVLEIDVPGMVFRVNGNDVYDSIRAAIGI